MKRALKVRPVIALALAVAAAVAGCGCSGSKTVTVTATSTSSASAATTGAPPSSTNGQSLDTLTATASTTSPAPTLHPTTFRSPSRNIGCIGFSGSVRCDIMKRNWSPPPRPPSCSTVVDFGQGLAVDRAGSVRFVCAGDTALDPRATPLAYGQDSSVGSIICASRTDGITCTEQKTGHGFFLSVQGYRIF